MPTHAGRTRAPARAPAAPPTRPAAPRAGSNPLWHRLATRVPEGTIQRQPDARPARPDYGRPLDESEWRLVDRWIGDARVAFDPVIHFPLTDDVDENAVLVAAGIFCDRRTAALDDSGDPLLCRDRRVPRDEPEVRRLVRHVQARGPIRREPLREPLDDAEWRQVEAWLARGEVDFFNMQVPLGADPDENALVVAAGIFCRRFSYAAVDAGDPLLCIDGRVPRDDVRVRKLVRHVEARGKLYHWPAVPLADRQLYVMDLLVDEYGYPPTGAAGLVGNLTAESSVLPSRVEGSAPETPLRARDAAGRTRVFTPEEAMNRRGPRRPEKPGVGLAQWTTPDRRRALFEHEFRGRPAGSSILFDMDAQVDFLVDELATMTPHVDRVLRRSGVSVDEASDRVVTDFERPQSIIDGGQRAANTRAARRRLSYGVYRRYQEARAARGGQAGADARGR